MGDDYLTVAQNVEVIKNIELDRLAKLQKSNPEIFLPPDIDITGEEFNFVEPDPSGENINEDNAWDNVQDTSDVPWIEVTSHRKSKSRRRLNI